MPPQDQAVFNGISSPPRGSSQSGYPSAFTSSLSTRSCRYAARAIPAASAALFALAQTCSSTRPWSMIFFELMLGARCARPLTAMLSSCPDVNIPGCECVCGRHRGRQPEARAYTGREYPMSRSGRLLGLPRACQSAARHGPSVLGVGLRGPGPHPPACSRALCRLTLAAVARIASRSWWVSGAGGAATSARSS